MKLERHVKQLILKQQQSTELNLLFGNTVFTTHNIVREALKAYLNTECTHVSLQIKGKAIPVTGHGGP
jgi:hypothetical protein